MSRKRWIWTIGLTIAAIAIAGGAFAIRSLPAYALIATGYVAQQTCACLHVADRALDSCMADFPADAVSNITVTTDGDRVEASALGLFRSAAVYEEGFGCSPVN